MNFALVGLIVDVFTETTEPIEDLTKAILYSCEVPLLLILTQCISLTVYAFIILSYNSFIIYRY